MPSGGSWPTIAGPFTREDLTITAHGDLRAWALRDRMEVAEQVLRQGYLTAQGAGMEPMLAHGTLLGIVRDDSLIAWDHDLDIYGFGPIDEEPFIDQGFELVRTQDWRGHRMQTAFRKHDVIFDINHLWFDGQDLVYVSEVGVLREPVRFFDGEMLRFRSARYRAPSPVTTYLAHRYADWRTPVNVKRIWTTDAGEGLRRWD